MNTQVPKSIQLTVFLVSCALVLILGSVAVWIQTVYFKHNPFFYDPVVYSWHSIKLFASLSHSNRFALALTEWLTNPKYPLRTVPLILFAPGLLANQLGYVATALPALLVFLVLLGWTIYQRTRSVAYALATSILFCSIPGLLSFHYGLGTYWLDLPATFWVGSTALALLNFIKSEKLKWLWFASTLAACASLSRYIAIAYVLVVCAPILGYALFKRWHQEKSFRRAVLLPLAASLLPLLLLSGYFLAAQFSANYDYYTKFGYALKQPPLDSFLAISRFLIDAFFGQPLCFALILIFCGYLALICQLAFIDKQFPKISEDLIITGWYAVSVILFLVAIGTKEAFQSMFYAAPLIFFAAVSPIPLLKEPGKISRSLKLVIVSSLIIFALLSTQHTIAEASDKAAHPTRPYREQNRLDFAIGRILSQEANTANKPMSWEAFFDEHNFMPSVEAFYQSKKLIEPAFRFTIHEAYWKALYPGLDPAQLSRKIYQETAALIDVVFVFADATLAGSALASPASVAQAPRFDNPYSQAVASYMATQIPQDANWKRFAVVRTKQYGRLIAYRNLARSNASSKLKCITLAQTC